MGIIKTLNEIRNRWSYRLDADSDDDKEKPKKHSALSTRLPFALCKEVGIDTDGMTPREAWEAYEGKTGQSASDVKAEKMGVDNTSSKTKEMRKKLVDMAQEVKKLNDDYQMEKMHLGFAEKHIKEYSAELDSYTKKLKDEYKDKKESQLKKDKDECEKRLEEVSTWLTEHKKRFSEMTEEERAERREKTNQKSKEIEELTAISEEIANRRSIAYYKQKLKEETNKRDEYQKNIEALQKNDVAVRASQALKEYSEMAKKRDAATLKKFKTVDDCKTSDDVSDYIRAKGLFYNEDGAFKADGRTDLSSMNVSDAKAFVKGAESVLNDYPKLKGKFSGMSCEKFPSSYSNAYGMAKGTLVVFNEDYFKDEKNSAAKKYDKDVEDGFHPQGTTLRSIVDHEYTHAIEALVNDKLGGDKAADVVMRRVQERLDGSYNPDNDDYYRFQVSEYSLKNRGIERDTKGNIISVNKDYGGNTEWLAEAMAEARTSPNPREVAVIVREEFEKLMKEADLL